MLELLHEAELKVLGMALDDAFRLAASGEVAAGYECLSVGLFRAEEFAEEGEEWAPDLVSRYESALGEYTRRYGVIRA